MNIWHKNSIPNLSKISHENEILSQKGCVCVCGGGGCVYVWGGTPSKSAPVVIAALTLLFLFQYDHHTDSAVKTFWVLIRSISLRHF